MMPFGLDIALTAICLAFLFYLIDAALVWFSVNFLIQQMNMILIGLCVVAIPVGFLIAIWG